MSRSSWMEGGGVSTCAARRVCLQPAFYEARVERDSSGVGPGSGYARIPAGSDGRSVQISGKDESDEQLDRESVVRSCELSHSQGAEAHLEAHAWRRQCRTRQDELVGLA
jgi:hypothetical protein